MSSFHFLFLLLLLRAAQVSRLTGKALSGSPHRIIFGLLADFQVSIESIQVPQRLDILDKVPR